MAERLLVSVPDFDDLRRCESQSTSSNSLHLRLGTLEVPVERLKLPSLRSLEKQLKAAEQVRPSHFFDFLKCFCICKVLVWWKRLETMCVFRSLRGCHWAKSAVKARVLELFWNCQNIPRKPLLSDLFRLKVYFLELRKRVTTMGFCFHTIRASW